MQRLAICWLGLCAAALPAQEVAPEGDPAEQLDTYLSRCAGFDWSGAVLVARGGQVLLQRGYGMADRARGVANTEQTLFEIASTTKQFTAAAILKLEEKGELSTGDRITKYLPGVPEERRDITIYHLLTHTSGMPRSAGGGAGPDLERAVAGYFTTPTARAPGERYEYWNGGYALLAGIVERVSGKGFMDYCREHLFAPAGLEDTGFTGDTHLDDRPMAIGYDGVDAVRPAVGHPYGSYGWHYRGMGGVVTSVLDLYRWDRALYGDGVLAESTRDKLFAPHLSNYACGWMVRDTERGTTRISHGGSVRGFHTDFVRFPDDDAAIVVTSNDSAMPVWPISGMLECILFDEKPRYPMPPETIALDETDLGEVEGTYELEPGQRFVVRRDGAGILLGAEGQAAVNLLLPYPDRPGATDPCAEPLARAVEITEKIAAGDVEMMRGMLLPGIPKDWPDRIVAQIWPEHLDKWGAFRSARALGATFVGPQRIQVALALEHAEGTSRCRVVFQGDKLNIFDLRDGPEFGSSRKHLPASDSEFVHFTFVGPQPPPITFERDDSGAVVALHVKRVLGTPQRCARVR